MIPPGHRVAVALLPLVIDSVAAAGSGVVVVRSSSMLLRRVNQYWHGTAPTALFILGACCRALGGRRLANYGQPLGMLLLL